MASQEDAGDNQQSPPPATDATEQEQPPPESQAQQSYPIPLYPEMIMAAIEALNEPNGSNKSAISKQIEGTYPNLPAAHTTLLSHHLNKMKQSGQLVLVKNLYMKPDPNAPPRRGRGRPPKPKTPLPAGTVVSPPRPRGRPPKPKDPFAPVIKTTSSGTGRPRGRPPKKAKTAASAPASAASSESSVRRGRGRPPKVKPAPVAPVAG